MTMPGDLQISKACSDDIEDLLLLYRHLIPDDPYISADHATEILRKFSTFGDSAIFLGRLKQTLVTSCTLLVVPNLTRGGRSYGLIENVVTDIDYRGHGYGQALLLHTVAYAWEHDCYKVMLMTGSTKPETHAFYETCGFSASKTGFQIRQIAARKE